MCSSIKNQTFIEASKQDKLQKSQKYASVFIDQGGLEEKQNIDASNE